MGERRKYLAGKKGTYSVAILGLHVSVADLKLGIDADEVELGSRGMIS